MAQGGFKVKTAHPSSSNKHGKKNGPKPGGKIIKPKKAHAVTAVKLQKKLTSEHVKRTEHMMMQKTRGAGEGQFRLLQADPKVVAAAQAAREKKEKKRAEEKERPVKMAPKKNL